jgi:hypothetical protein
VKQPSVLWRPPGLVRHGLRHTADVDGRRRVDLHILQRVAGHQNQAVTSRYLHPDTQAMLDGTGLFRLGCPELVRRSRWAPSGPWRGMSSGSDLRKVRPQNGGLTGFEPATR